MATRAYSEARLQWLAGWVILGVGLAMLPFSGWLSATTDYPEARGIVWYERMLLHLPYNIGTIIAIIMIVVGGVSLLRARRTARILTDGIAAQAAILEIGDTGTRVNHQPRLRLRLSVAAPGQEPYEVTVKKVVPLLYLARLRSGLPMPVRIDPHNRNGVALDWAAAAEHAAAVSARGALAAGGAGTDGAAWSAAHIATPVRTGTPHIPGLPHLPRPATSRDDLKAQIRAVGVPGTATLTAVIPMDPVDDRRLFRMDLNVRLDNGASYIEQDEPVPIDHQYAAKAVAGTQVPIRVALVDGVATTLFEWERV